MKNNDEILKARVSKFDHTRIGPRVGDYLYIPSNDPRVPEYTRFTHIWDDTAQTGGNEGSSYYMGESGKLSYSGGLDHGVNKKDLICTGHHKNGNVWFFDKGIAGAGRGVTFSIPMMVYTVYEGADISGVWSRNCPFHLSVLDEASHLQTCGYWYLIDKHATSHTAFKTESELLKWIEDNNLKLTKPLTPAGVRSDQMLGYGEV